MALSCGLTVARTYCLPSPCARLSRARTTTETPPLIRDVASLGSLPASRAGARIEVPVFRGVTLDALGGRLCPWQRGPHTRFGRRWRRSHFGHTQPLGNVDPALAA